MADLPTNLKDDILDSSVNTRRKYRMIENEDGTYSFEDLTKYNQVGDEYGAGLINETNRQVNARVEKAVVVRDLETIGAITQPGFIPDALALKDVNDSLVTPFVDFSANDIATITTHNGSWVASENCFCIARLGAGDGVNATVGIDGVTAVATGLATSPSATYPYMGTCYVKKGQVVTTGNYSGHKYDLLFKPLFK